MDSKVNCSSRHGAYGVVLQDAKMLFTLKKSGPFKGLWGLPGGAIEFGETPEEALKRELLEETALAASELELLSIATTVGEYEHYRFHYIGIIYKVSNIILMPDLVQEEECCRIALKEINHEELTPFAKQVLQESFNLICSR